MEALSLIYDIIYLETKGYHAKFIQINHSIESKCIHCLN